MQPKFWEELQMGLKTKLAMAVATSAAGAAMIAGGTFAEFSSQASTTANTFSSGTLQLALNPNGSGWGAHDTNVGATWVSPSNWAPGESMEATLQLSDTGTIGAKHVFFTFAGLNDSNPSLLSQIYITSIKEKIGTTVITTSPATIASQIGVTAGQPLTLAAFVSHQYMTADDGSTNGGYVIQAGNKQDYSLTLDLTFNDNADNTYQGKSASFDMNLNATQNTPTDGYIELHQAPAK
jgi:spore coat-associated protein N